MLSLVGAQAAGADTINLKRFSKAVGGNAGGPYGVTVNLLRNTIDGNGLVARQQVDSFTATVNPGGDWSGSFAKHAFAVAADEVEVNYTGVGAPPRVTIGAGHLLPSASASPAHVVGVSADQFATNAGIASDGSIADVSSCGCDPVTATVDGGPPLADVGGIITFTPHVTNTNAVFFSGTFTDGPTTVHLTDQAPLLSPVGVGQTPPVTQTNSSQPACTFYLVSGEVVCYNLTPGAYTVSQVRAGAPVGSQPLTVPSRTAVSNLIPSLGAAAFASVAGGDQLKLLVGSRVLSTLTVAPSTIQRNSPHGDLQNGSNSVVTGTCTMGVFFTGGDLCIDGSIPQPNTLADRSTSLFGVGSTGRTLGQLDDTSAGSTEIDMPRIAFESPFWGEAVRAPFTAYAQVRFTTPTALATVANTQVNNGPSPIAPSTPSSAPVNLSYAPFGSPTFTALGNANTTGGLALPATLSPGQYLLRSVLTDARGDTQTTERPIVVQSPLPQGPPLPSCSARSSGGLSATVAAVKHAAKKPSKKKKKKAKKPKKPALITVTVSCASNLSGARIAVWLDHGGTQVASGGGVVRGGSAQIALAGKFVRGTYLLTEVIDSGGASSESTRTLTLR
jgi:hypothetical protein